MNPYTFQCVFGLQSCSSPENQPSFLAEAYAAYTSDQQCTLALARSEDVLFLTPNEDDPEGQFTVHMYSWPGEAKSKSVSCMTFSPCGRWLVCVLATGTIEVVPVSLALELPINANISQSSPALFPTNELSTIDLRIRDDCLGLPTCVLWYETRQKRQMLIYSNKGGDILFVDLVVRRLSASLQAPQSIHNLEIIEEAAHDDVYLLVSGFAGTQWLVPLEQGNLTLRETLARIVPSELKELHVRGSVSAVCSGGRNCIGVLYEDAFRLFSTTNFGAPILDIVLPENTFAVRYTDLITFTVHKQIFVSYSLNGCSINEYASPIREEFTLRIGKLPGCRLLGFVALPAADKECLPSCLLVTETAVYFAASKWTTREFLANLLLADRSLALVELYCQAVGLSFPASCFDAIPALLERKAVERALQICNLSKAPLYDIAKQFMERGFASFILPHIDSWLLDGLSKASSTSEQTKRELSQLAFELHVETCRNSEGLERNKAEQRFKKYLHCNIWYDSDYCLKALLKLKMYDGAIVVVKVHGLYESIAKELITMDAWNVNDEFFLLLASVPGLSSVLLDPNSKSMYCHHYLSRVENLYAKLNWKQRVRFLALFDPEREEMKVLLEIAARFSKRAEPSAVSKYFKSMLNTVVQFFISSLVSFLYETSSGSIDESESVQKIHQSDSPEPVPLACGAEHGCVIASDGSLYAFGRFRRVCLGDRPDSQGCAPLAVPLPCTVKAKAVQVACGADHTLALMDNGSVYSWGSNKYGQLGVGRDCSQANKPQGVNMVDSAAIRRIECGQYHSFALDTKGKAWGWGWNLHRQVGAGNRADDVFIPATVAIFETLAVKAISCGYAHTVFLTEGGIIYGCGNNAYGQLAMGEKKKTLVPSKLNVGKGLTGDCNGDTFSLIASGYFHNIALSTGGRLFTWGATPQSLKFKALLKKRKKHEQVSGTDSRSVSSIMKAPDAQSAGPVTGLVDAKELRPSFVDLGGIKADKIVQLSCGFHHCLLRTDDGRIYTWGKNFEFQLGHGDKKERPCPTSVTTIGQHISYAACGSDFTMAIDENSLIWGWGKNDSGQLGFESLAPSEKNSMAGRVLTIQKPNKGGQRTIQLPQDTRAYVPKPVRVPGLRSMWPADNGNEKEVNLKKRYTPLFLMDTMKTLIGHYDLTELVAICDRCRAKEIASFAYLVNGNVTLSCRTLLESLANSHTNQLMESMDRIDQVLLFYSDLASRCLLSAAKLADILTVIFNHTEFFHSLKFDLNSFIERNLALWAPGIVQLLSEDPKTVPLKPHLRMRAVQLVRQGCQKTVVGKEKHASYVDVDQQDVQLGGCPYLYKFKCGHLVREKQLNTLKDVATDELILQQSPRIAALLQQYLEDVKHLPSDACPICLKQGLSRVFSGAAAQ